MKTFFENFPWWMVATCNVVGVSIYALGLLLMLQLGTIWGAVYAAYCVGMEYRLLSGSCRRCHYYGKRCGFGKGRICSWFFTKADEKNSGAEPITWVDVVPDFMVSLAPLGVGIAILLWKFSWFALLLVLLLATLGSVGTGLVRGRLACRYCRQRELGCPAEQLFGKTKPVEKT